MKEFIIDDSERKRILKLHESATKRQYLKESAEDLRDALDDLGYKEKGSEISNNGEITDELSSKAIELFNVIKRRLPKVKIKVTAGNDRYHSNVSGSLHPKGMALDFTVKPTKYNSMIEDILKDFRVKNPGFRYMNEYVKKSKNWTGGHFHISYDKGVEVMNKKGLNPINKAIPLATLKNIESIQPELKDIEFRVIGMGSRGEDVEFVQGMLDDLGYDLGIHGIDGKFGPDTKSAVEKYQKDNSLKIDGIVGPETYGSLFKIGL